MKCLQKIGLALLMITSFTPYTSIAMDFDIDELMRATQDVLPPMTNMFTIMFNNPGFKVALINDLNGKSNQELNQLKSQLLTSKRELESRPNTLATAGVHDKLKFFIDTILDETTHIQEARAAENRRLMIPKLKIIGGTIGLGVVAYIIYKITMKIKKSRPKQKQVIPAQGDIQFDKFIPQRVPIHSN